MRVFDDAISIHLMLLFNLRNLQIQFHYLQISIHLMLLFNLKLSSNIPISDDFNTSNVTIQQLPSTFSFFTYIYFNTSNVTIQHCLCCLLYCCIIISIHLMLLFNSISLSVVFIQSDFNTSNVTIQPTILSHLFYSQFHYTHYISTFS